MLLFATNAMVLAGLQHQSTAGATGQLRGTVADINEARVAGATVTVEGERVTRAVITDQDGTYRIELPTGIYRIRVNNRGFCPARRAPFRVQPSNPLMLNFTLITCPIVYGINIVDGQYAGETDRYKDPLKEEVFPLIHPSGAPLELLVSYGEREEKRDLIEYRGTVMGFDEHADTPTGSIRRDKYLRATFSYDSLMIRADKAQLNPRTFQLEAEGNVVIEDGKRQIQAKRVVADLKTAKLRVEPIP